VTTLAGFSGSLCFQIIRCLYFFFSATLIEQPLTSLGTCSSSLLKSFPGKCEHLYSFRALDQEENPDGDPPLYRRCMTPTRMLSCLINSFPLGSRIPIGWSSPSRPDPLCAPRAKFRTLSTLCFLFGPMVEHCPLGHRPPLPGPLFQNVPRSCVNYLNLPTSRLLKGHRRDHQGRCGSISPRKVVLVLLR